MPLIDIKKLADFAYNKLTAKGPGTMLLITGTFGWILSSIAQVTAVIKNNKIPKEQKKFLIPQEISDAAVNIASFYIITRSFTKWGTKLVNGGKLVNPAIRDFLKNANLADKIGTKQLYEIEKKGEKVAEELHFSIPMEKAFKEATEETKGKFYRFSDSMDFIFGTVGAIVSSNIVTPIGRNAIASVFQKYNSGKPVMNPATPVMPMFTTRTNMDNYTQKIAAKPSVSPIITSNSGSLRI